MNKKVGILIIILAGALLVWGVVSIAHLIIIKRNGSEITARVLKAETDCDRYNEIEVIYAGKTYHVTISRTDCRNEVYKVGQNVTLIKHKDNDTLVWPQAKYEWLPFLLLTLVALAYLANKDKFGNTKKPTPNKGLAKKRL